MSTFTIYIFLCVLQYLAYTRIESYFYRQLKSNDLSLCKGFAMCEIVPVVLTFFFNRL